mmetsp:Transcript_22405/g.19907  ORF Transcript_22405/g.19907 Transcript_22405/m.19907 type:complete len:92 (+) Transcript_22405:582-857(+)
MLRKDNLKAEFKNISEASSSKNIITNSSLDSEEEDHHYLNEAQFFKLLDKLRLNDDKNFSMKLFTIFCFSGKGKVDFYELFHRIFQFCMIK